MSLVDTHVFQPIATDTRGAFSYSELGFLAKRLSDNSGDSCETCLFQGFSVVFQCFNSVLIRESFAGVDKEPDLKPLQLLLLHFSGFNPRVK